MSNVRIRTTVGAVLLVAAVAAMTTTSGGGRPLVGALIAGIGWVLSVIFTDKYVNKYPRRYVSYLLASHLKAATTMAVTSWILGALAGPVRVPPAALWGGVGLFVLVDALVSLLWRPVLPVGGSDVPEPIARADTPRDAQRFKSPDGPGVVCSDEHPVVSRAACPALTEPLAGFVARHAPGMEARRDYLLVEGEAFAAGDEPLPRSDLLIVGGFRLNDVRHLGRFLLSCADRLQPRGYLVGRYLPLENDSARLRVRYSGPCYWAVSSLQFAWHRALPKIPRLNALYFVVTKGKNRVISRTELWGRLQSCGLRVIGETDGDGELLLIAQQTGDRPSVRNPSYFPVIALERVGLDGQIIRAHKVRTMYPFSEFLQKRVFDDNALGQTGKFAGDPRITGYGRFLRKYWVDEVPQILDWWRGDLKLVGLRAISLHYFSLYPPDFQALYVTVKPGLVPPIFSESTAGFEEILAVERAYLESYRSHPVRTDVRYLWKTVHDIVFKGIRSH